MTIEQPMLPADFPEPVLTCDLIIEREIADYFTQQEHMLQAMRESHKFDAKDRSDAANAARYKMTMHMMSAIAAAAITDLLQTIQRMAPGLADGIARDFDGLHESGESGEIIWDWATERGLDPEAIIEEAKFAIASSTPCADKSAAKGAKEMRREKSAAYRETINLDANEHPELATLETDIRTALPHNLTGDAVVRYVSRHLYADGYRKQEGTK